jgi:hypothetical protein
MVEMRLRILAAPLRFFLLLAEVRTARKNSEKHANERKKLLQHHYIK